MKAHHQGWYASEDNQCAWWSTNLDECIHLLQ